MPERRNSVTEMRDTIQENDEGSFPAILSRCSTERMVAMISEYCQNCGSKTIWVERTEVNGYSFESGCPRCLLHVSIKNGRVEVSRPDKTDEAAPEPRKPREFSIGVHGDRVVGGIRSDDVTKAIYCGDVGVTTLRVREVIE